MRSRVAGLWWISSKPDNKVAGNLLIEDRKLELIGSFDDIKLDAYDGLPKIVKAEQQTTIQGVARDGGEKYTLEHFADPSHSTVHSYRADTYRLGDIFIGKHIDKTKNLTFDEYCIKFPYLYEWLNDGVVAASTTLEGKILRRKSTTITIGCAKAIEIYEDEKIKLSLVSTVSKMPILSIGKNINIEQECILEIKSKKSSLPLFEALSIIIHFQRFHIIAVGQSLEPIDIEAKADSAMGYTTVLPRRFKKKEYGDIHIYDMNLTFDDIKTECKTLFASWFASRDKYADIFDLFSVLCSDTPKMLENELKDIIGAIEGYVRIEQGNLDIRLDRAIKTMNEAIPKNDRPLKRSDYKKIRITRNQLSHMSIKPDDSQFILSHEEMCFTYEKLLVLFEYSVLKSLGLSPEILKQFYNKRKSW